MRQVLAPAGVATRVFRRRFSSVPLDVEFEVAAAPGGTVAGRVMRVGSRWVLGRVRSTAPLLESNRVRKGFWDTWFDVYVLPEMPVTVTVRRPAMRSRIVVGALALLVVAAAATTVFLVAY